MPRSERAKRRSVLGGPLWPSANLQAISEYASAKGLGELAAMARATDPDDAQQWAKCSLQLREQTGYEADKWLQRRTWILIDQQIRDAR